MTDQYEVQFSTKLKRPTYLRVGIVAACALVLLVSAAVTIAASPTPSSSTGAAAGQATPAPGGNGGFGNGRRAFGGMGMGPGGGMPGIGMPGMGMPGGGMPGAGMAGKGGRGMGGFREFGFGQITIAAINGSDLSLKTADGWTRTIAVTTSTTITRSGQTIALGDLKVGDAIRFRETRNSDGTFTINAIDVVLPEVGGTVASISDGGFTVKERDGTTWTVTVTGSTTFSLGRQSASKSDVKVGDEVLAEGTQTSSTSLTATAVRIAPASVVGQVTAVSGSTITIKQFDGTTATINVSSSTTYQVPGVTSPSLVNVTVGSMVAAEGTRNSDGSLQATTVRTGPGKGMWRGGGPTAPAPGSPGGAGSQS